MVQLMTEQHQGKTNSWVIASGKPQNFANNGVDSTWILTPLDITEPNLEIPTQTCYYQMVKMDKQQNFFWIKEEIWNPATM